MSWRDSLKPASFRGVPFSITDHDLSGGRRVASHEYPQRDVPYVEDMGRKQRSYSISAFVIGNDYMTARDALLTALEASGSGVLVHPYLGTLTVQVDTFSLSETRDDGGMASFSISFLQAEPAKYPTAVTNTSAQVNITGQTAIAQANTLMGSSLNVEAKPSSVVSHAEQTTTDVVTAIQSETKQASRTSTNTLDIITGKINQLDEFMRDTARIVANVSVMVRKPADLAYQLTNSISKLRGMTDTALNAFRAYSRLFDYLNMYFSGMSFLPTPSGTQAQINAQVIREAVLLAVASNAASTSLDIDFETNMQAYEIRDDIIVMLDTIMGMTSDDALYQSVTDLRTSVFSAIPPDGVRLQDVVSVQVLSSITSLMFAYQVFGSVDDEQDIITRNRISNPWNIPGGSSVQVLK